MQNDDEATLKQASHYTFGPVLASFKGSTKLHTFEGIMNAELYTEVFGQVSCPIST